MTLHLMNPNHEVSQLMTDGESEIAMKLLAILTWKAGGSIEVTFDDLNDFTGQPKNVFITHFHAHSITLSVVTLEEGEKISAAAGGLPS